jgi:DNA-binding MurR/RpiR family transcriptional regulator
MPVAEQIVDVFEGLPEQLRKAARYVLDNPDDVALLSMREQARRAGIPPWTMSRLARRLGYDGYEAIRTRYADALRSSGVSLTGRASVQVEDQKLRGEEALAADIIKRTAAQIERLASPATLKAISEAAVRLDEARRIFCLGLRSSYVVAAQFAYVMTLLGEKAELADGNGSTGIDCVRFATPDDALLVISVAPYTRATIEAAVYAQRRGVPLVAITDSPVAPLVSVAATSIIVTTDSPSFFHAMAPAFTAGEVLAALVAGRGGERSLAALRQTEAQLAAFGVHWKPAQKGPVP